MEFLALACSLQQIEQYNVQKLDEVGLGSSSYDPEGNQKSLEGQISGWKLMESVQKLD